MAIPMWNGISIFRITGLLMRQQLVRYKEPFFVTEMWGFFYQIKDTVHKVRPIMVAFYHRIERVLECIIRVINIRHTFRIRNCNFFESIKIFFFAGHIVKDSGNTYRVPSKICCRGVTHLSSTFCHSPTVSPAADRPAWKALLN